MNNVKSVIIVERIFDDRPIEHALNYKQIKILMDNLTNLSSKNKIKVLAKYRISIFYTDSTIINLMATNNEVAKEANYYYPYPENFHIEDLLKLN